MDGRHGREGEDNYLDILGPSRCVLTPPATLVLRTFIRHPSGVREIG